MSPSEPRIPLPKFWPIHVRAGMLHVIALAQFATAHTRSWVANRVHARIRLQAERDRAVQELALQREETRIKDARMASINPHRRPHYPPAERLAILELKAARGWSLERTARVFHVTAPTGAYWLGPRAACSTQERVKDLLTVLTLKPRPQNLGNSAVLLERRDRVRHSTR